MAKKQEKEVERWITVNGARVPIFKDGSVGGPKELRDKLKAHSEKKSSKEDFVISKESADLQLKKDEEKYLKNQKRKASKLQKAKDKYEANKEESLKRSIAKSQELSKQISNNDSEYKSKYYAESQLKDEKWRKDALEEMRRYERNWNYYPLKERREISPNGVKDLRARIKDLENYEKASKANTIKANEDLKEKQIARNKAEKDAINGKKAIMNISGGLRLVADVSNPNKNIDVAKEALEKYKNSGNYAKQKQLKYQQDVKIQKEKDKKLAMDILAKAGVGGDTLRQKAKQAKQEARVSHESLMGETYKQAKSNLASMGKGELATIARKLGIPSRFIKEMDADKLRDRLLFIYKGSHK